MKKLFYLILPVIPLAFACCGDEGGDGRTDENAVHMQQFVIDISNYARGLKPGFIVIPQNGCELAFDNTDPADGIMQPYMDAIDGIGIEELFYNGKLSVDTERLAMLRTLGQSVTVMVSDHVSDELNIPDAVQRSRQEGFIAFPRAGGNYDYGLIPPGGIEGANANDISALSDAANYLYLISTDGFPDKQAMIQAIAATDYDVVLIDMFFEGVALTAAETGLLKTKANGGKRLVIAYLSIGSAENWRYYWQPGWKKGNPPWLKKNYDGYPDELWVEYRNEEWRQIIFGNDGSYIKKVVDAGFDGAYLDNVEAYYFLER